VGGGPLTSKDTTLDIFVAKYDAEGTHLWSRAFGSSAPGEQGWGASADGFGNVFITGEFNGIVDFGGGPIPNQSLDVFLAKYGCPLLTLSPGEKGSFNFPIYNATVSPNVVCFPKTGQHFELVFS
jgi:hypothetical protein